MSKTSAYFHCKLKKREVLVRIFESLRAARAQNNPADNVGFKVETHCTARFHNPEHIPSVAVLQAHYGASVDVFDSPALHREPRGFAELQGDMVSVAGTASGRINAYDTGIPGKASPAELPAVRGSGHFDADQLAIPQGCARHRNQRAAGTDIDSAAAEQPHVLSPDLLAKNRQFKPLAAISPALTIRRRTVHLKGGKKSFVRILCNPHTVTCVLSSIRLSIQSPCHADFKIPFKQEFARHYIG